MKELLKNLKVLANSIGFGSGLVGYDKLHGTAINTFGHKNASMWFLTISLNSEDLICGIEINSTYFKPTKQTIAINKVASFNTPLSFEKAFEILKEIKHETS